MKRMSGAAAGVVAVACLLAGTTAGTALGRRPVRTVEPVPSRPEAAAPPNPRPVRRESPAAAAAPARPARELTLAELLEKARPILLAKLQLTDPSELSEAYRPLWELWPPLLQAALKDPAGYLAFLRAPENEVICDELLDVFGSLPGCPYYFPAPEPLPPAIQNGFVELARSGSVEQKRAIARWVRDLGWKGFTKGEPWMIEPCLALASSDDPLTRAA